MNAAVPSPLSRLIFAVVICVTACTAVAAPAPASAGTFEVDACYPWTNTSGVFHHAAVFGIGTSLACNIADPSGVGMGVFADSNTVPAGTHASWYTETPSGLSIIGVVVPAHQMNSIGIDDGTGWGGGFWWPGGGASVTDLQPSFAASMNTNFFEWQVVCGQASCNGYLHGADIYVNSIRLFIQETRSPSITSTSPLYNHTGWIRGNGWPLTFQTDDPSGVCQTRAVVGKTAFAGGATLDPNHTAYHQCSQTSFAQTVNTTDDPNGPLAITLEAQNAAGNWATPASTVHVDNTPVALTLSGPTDAPSTAGTQYITASATAGPSGVSGIACKLDGGASHTYPAAVVRIPVSGLGVHHLTCYAANRATDPSGKVATSAAHSWSLRIGEPTAMGITFTRTANPLRCRRVSKRVKHKVIRVIRCHPRTVREKVTVWQKVKRHGKTIRVKRTKWRRVVVQPRGVATTTLRVPHGKGTTVYGSLAALDGSPLAGQPITVYAAPDNGLGHFAPVATTTTGAGGTWSAPLRAGPSRLVEAAYGGSPTLEPTMSGRVRLIVPAKVRLLSVTPRRAAWGTTLRIVGQLVGGYLPPGGENVRLRYGIGRSFTTWGVQEHVTGNGRFTTKFKLGKGPAGLFRRYWFSLAALPTSSYPFAQARSGRRYVLVGGHPSRSR